MKGKKQCIAFLTLFALFAPLFLTSSDANALKYSINSIPLVTPVYPNDDINSNIGYNYVMYEPLTVNSSENFSLKDFYWIKFQYNSNTNQCDYKSYDHAVQSLSAGQAYLIPYYIKPVDSFYNSSVLGTANCNTRASISNINTNSVPPYVFGNPNLRSYLPYRFPYAGIYLNDSYKKDGYDRVSKFEFSDLFEDGIPDSFTQLTIPIGNVTKDLSNKHLEYKGSLYFDSDTPDTSVLTLGNNSSMSVNVFTYSDFKTQSGGSPPFTANCSMSVRRNPNTNEAPYILDYSCPFDMPSDAKFSGFTLNWFGNPVWSYANTWRIYWDSSVVITDNDPTPAPAGDEWTTFHVTGNFVGDAPGSASYTNSWDVTQDGVNWTQSLGTLFDFSLLNPFAPIFNLFTDQNSCAQIPTIASMIHSQETQVCPWFNSSTRNIVTPVLGLSSMMLLFGFVVHWLGARSGNLFEDSVETDNYSFTNKFRRKK